MAEKAAGWRGMRKNTPASCARAGSRVSASCSLPGALWGPAKGEWPDPTRSRRSSDLPLERGSELLRDVTYSLGFSSVPSFLNLLSMLCHTRTEYTTQISVVDHRRSRPVMVQPRHQTRTPPEPRHVPQSPASGNSSEKNFSAVLP